MSEHRSDEAGCDPAVRDPDAHRGSTRTQGAVVERLARYGTQVVPGALQRRSRLQRQQEVSDSSGGGGAGGLLLQREAPERSSLTPAMRKKYLKELLLSNPSNSGLSCVLSQTRSTDSSDPEPGTGTGTGWALYPMEHAWMLSAVEGSYDTILEFISADPHLLTRRDFISGYSVLHWLAKRGQDETLLRLLRHAEGAGIPVNVNVRGSGGLTPLHVASMHRQYMVVKLLVGAFSADVDAMDYNGRRAWQYLREDAPLEMRELLGTWDDEHSCGSAGNVNNNNCCGAVSNSQCDDEEDHHGEEEEEVKYFERTSRAGSWRFGSLRKLMSSFSFRGNKS